MPIDLGRKILKRLGRKLTPSDEALFVAKQVTRLTRSIKVNLKARAAAALRAGGKCELCRAQAPFMRVDGTPYLELHHIVPLATGGKEALSNLVMLCPNCHRKMHLNPDNKDIESLSLTAQRSDLKPFSV